MKPTRYEESLILKFSKDYFGLVSLALILAFLLIALLVLFGFCASDWHMLLNENGYSPISKTYWFGTNFNGQDIFSRCLFSTKTAFEVACIVSFGSTFAGSLLGIFAGYYSGRWTDRIITWLFSCFDAIPFYLLVSSIAFSFKDTQMGIYLALIGAQWTSTCKVLRAEVMKVKNFEFITSARSIGMKNTKILSSHILPNLIPLIIVEASLSFVLAIKTEAVLSFLGIGIKNGVSWGGMLAEASMEIQAGYWNNFLSASLFMFVFIMALNQFSDSLQRAFSSN